MIRFNIRDMDKVVRIIGRIPNNITRELDGSNTKFMKAVKKSAKLRAPRDTGTLKNSIILEPVRKGKNVKIWRLSVNAPYAGFQEYGFTPHYAPIGGSRKMAPGVYFVKKFTPFLEPAIKHNLKTFRAKLNGALGRGIKK